jgi:integrase
VYPAPGSRGQGERVSSRKVANHWSAGDPFRVRNRVGVEIAFHDLRHTGQSMAASTGATVVDLKKRLGHASSAAALRYIDAVEGRGLEIAIALSDLALDGNAAKLPSSF